MTAPVPLAELLADLARWGWRPLLYFDAGDSPLHASAPAWVAYPQGEVRVWTSVRAEAPEGAIRALHAHAVAHPNVPPVPLPQPVLRSSTTTTWYNRCPTPS